MAFVHVSGGLLIETSGSARLQILEVWKERILRLICEQYGFEILENSGNRGNRFCFFRSKKGKKSVLFICLVTDQSRLTPDDQLWISGVENSLNVKCLVWNPDLWPDIKQFVTRYYK